MCADIPIAENLNRSAIIAALMPGQGAVVPFRHIGHVGKNATRASRFRPVPKGTSITHSVALDRCQPGVRKRRWTAVSIASSPRVKWSMGDCGHDTIDIDGDPSAAFRARVATVTMRSLRSSNSAIDGTSSGTPMPVTSTPRRMRAPSMGSALRSTGSGLTDCCGQRSSRCARGCGQSGCSPGLW